MNDDESIIRKDRAPWGVTGHEEDFVISAATTEHDNRSG